MVKFSINTFVIGTIVFGLLMTLSFICAFALDEGTLPDNMIWKLFAQFFNIMRFPTHTIFFKTFVNDSAIYFGGLLLNCAFYGLLSERLLTFLRNRRKIN